MWAVKRLRKSCKKLQALRRERDGVAAVEFAMVALPFFFLLIAILETGYIFFLSILIEGAAADSARQVRIGAITTGTPLATFQTLVCNRMFGLVPPPCNDLIYDVRVVADFASTLPLPPFPTSQGSASFLPGVAGDIVVVRVVYPWTFITPYLESLVTAGGTRHLVSTVAFRNEPYGTP